MKEQVEIMTDWSRYPNNWKIAKSQQISGADSEGHSLMALKKTLHHFEYIRYHSNEKP